ncbi:HAMP domain-containing sensor histidine kinase [Rufibacter sp. LB8]|uniref:HAMP domain-containing sensor histidine kinase n=1 Tax=Rufibacter sp. LB8 TaxID=2777781 RepID=UPI00178C6EBB|nr:HAMP domain-containing sensor histidine kinase [Rufibacter sp. LB8]
MKIKTRLTLQFAAIFTGILLVFCLAVYYFSSEFRQNDFYARITNRAIITANYVLGADTASAATKAAQLRQYYQVLPKEVVHVYDANQKLLFAEGEGNLLLSRDFFSQIKDQGQAQDLHEDRQMVGIKRRHQGQEYFVVASSVDMYNLTKLHHLRTLLIIGFFLSVVIVVLSGIAFSRAALAPFLKVVSEVKTIKASALHRRLSRADGTDEVAYLAQTFNNLLDRLETAFESQRTFVYSASHELRTPLTAMIGELQVALMSKRSPEEYERVLASILDDAHLLTQLSNGLLQMVQASTDYSKIPMTHLQLDELIWQACAEARKRQPALNLDVSFVNLPDDENELMINGNEALLLIATVNVLENAAKFSGPNPTITASIEVSDKRVVFCVQDKGIGMSPDDVKKVFVPFFRAENVRDISGHGIGLPLAEKIIQLHRGTIQIESMLNKGTKVCISLPKLYSTIKL